MKHLAVTGCSFGGKTRYAGAFDERMEQPSLPKSPSGMIVLLTVRI